VSKFHLIWCPIALSDKVQNSRTLFGPTPDIVRPRVFTPTFVHCFGHSLLFGYPIDPIFPAVFITLSGSFIRYWFVCSSPSCSVLALEFELGT
jgi:hypothetical protein